MADLRAVIERMKQARALRRRLSRKGMTQREVNVRVGKLCDEAVGWSPAEDGHCESDNEWYMYAAFATHLILKGEDLGMINWLGDRDTYPYIWLGEKVD